MKELVKALRTKKKALILDRNKMLIHFWLRRIVNLNTTLFTELL